MDRGAGSKFPVVWHPCALQALCKPDETSMAIALVGPVTKFSSW